MSETEQILDKFRESQGWTDKTILDLSLAYIEDQGNPERWEEYLAGLAETDDDIEDDPARLQTADVKVRFHPQAWQNDYAIDVDAEGETDWYVSEASAELITARLDLDHRADLDDIKEDHFAPLWVKNWDGPFYITEVDR